MGRSPNNCFQHDRQRLTTTTNHREPLPKHVPRHPLHTDERMSRSAKKKSTQQRRGGPRFAWEEEDEVMALVLTFNNQRVAAAPTLFDIMDKQDKVDYLAPSQVYREFDSNTESTFTSPDNCFQHDRQRLTTTTNHREPLPKHVPRHPLHTDERMSRSAKKKSTQQRRGGPRFALGGRRRGDGVGTNI
jgi:hypothetical protein